LPSVVSNPLNGIGLGQEAKKMSTKLANRVTVVTGGGGGIGAAICRLFAQEGARVAVTDRLEEAAEQVAAQILRSGGVAASWALDVAHRDAVERVADQVESRLGPLAIWVNSAGVSRIVPFLECTEETWDLTLRVNLKGTFLCCQAAIRRMLPRRQGVILNLSSQSGRIGNSHYAAYCASKFGVIGLTQSLAAEFAGQGIRANALCPGVIFTPMWEAQVPDYARKKSMRPEQVRPYLEGRIPMGRLGSPEDVARMALFLASDDASYVTGQALNVNGGWLMS
jgi:NAD(P)-dependent dehydrogenase (short-subunit alcohol dehydrogenase family)